MNYAGLDAGKNWHYKEERLEWADYLGYKYISEMVHKLHIEYDDSTIVGEIVGINKNSVNGLLRYMGVNNKGKGGRNYTKLTNELVSRLRTGWDGVGAENHYFERFMKETGLKMSYVGLRSALKADTWSDVEARCQQS